MGKECSYCVALSALARSAKKFDVPLNLEGSEMGENVKAHLFHEHFVELKPYLVIA